MKKLNITKEQFNESRYFKNKYGTLEYVSESGKYFKTNKGQVVMFKESDDYQDEYLRSSRWSNDLAYGRCNNNTSKKDKKIKKSKKMNEVSGWDLEDDDLTLVNDESDGDKLYIVKMWWGSGYVLDCYNAWAFDVEGALNHVVAWIEKNNPEQLEAVDEYAMDYLEDLVKDGEAETEEEAYEHPYFQETFLWVDATREGAQQGHYVYNENLTIAEYPAKHNHPLAKGVDKSKFMEKEEWDRRSNADPVTDVEREFAKWLEQCIEEEFEVFCSCNFHNPGEEQHIEIYFGPEDVEALEAQADGEMDVTAKLEEFVNQVGEDGDTSGERWGDANFNYDGDGIFGEIWPERLWQFDA